MDSTLPKKSPAAEAAQRAAQRHEALSKEHEQKRAAAEHKREASQATTKQQKNNAHDQTVRARRGQTLTYKSPPGNKSPQSWDYRSTTEAVVRKYKKPNLADKQIMGLNATFSAKADDTKDAGMAQNPYESTRYVIPAEREPMDRADGVEVGYDKNVAAADKNMQLKRRKALKLAQMYRIDEDGGLGGDSGLGAGVSPMPGSFGGSSGATATRITGNPDGTGNYMLKGKTNKMKTLKIFKNEMGTPNKPFYNFGEEVDHIDEAKLPPLHKRTENQQIAHDLGLDQEYSKKYPGGEKQRAKDNAAFLKRFPPPKNEEVEQVDESKIKDSINKHPAVEYYGSKDDHHMIDLKPGYIHSELEQHSFSNRNASDAKKELKSVKKCDCDNCKAAKVYATKEEVEQVDESKIKDLKHGMNRGGSLETERIKHPVGQRPKGIGWVLKSAGEQTGKDHSVWERKFKRVPAPTGLGDSSKNNVSQRSYDEEVEQVDEISTKLANKYVTKASKQSQKPDAKNRDAGMGMAYAKVQGRHVNVPTTEAHDYKHKESMHTDSKGAYIPGTKVRVGDKTGEISHVYHSASHKAEGPYYHAYKISDDKKSGSRLENGNFIPHNRVKLNDTVKEEYSIKHIKSGKTFSTHDDEASAMNEHNALGHGKTEYAVVKTLDEAGNYTNIPSVVSNKVASGMTRAMHKAAAKRYEADADDAHKEGKTHKRDWANDMAKNHHQAAKEMESVKEDTKPKAPKETVPFEGGHSRPKVHKDKFGNVIKPENMARHLARAAIPEEVMSEGELDGGSMSGKANDALEVGSVDTAKTKLMGKVKKVQEMAVRDAAGKKHTIKNVEIRMADGTLKSLPPGKSGSSGGGGK